MRSHPSHACPSFEADRFGGVSIFHGKFKRSKGSVTIDREANTGALETSIDLSSVDGGFHSLDGDLLRGREVPNGGLQGNGARVSGRRACRSHRTLTMHGVAEPSTLKIESLRIESAGPTDRLFVLDGRLEPERP